MFTLLAYFDDKIIHGFQRIALPLLRFSLFTVYFWFGILKLLGLSPAEPLVQALFEKTIAFVPFATFYPAFAIFEMLIGVLFLLRGFERTAIFFLMLHMITTAMPLFLLTDMTWQSTFVPTLTGQYILKNVLIIAAAVMIGSTVTPLKFKR